MRHEEVPGDVHAASTTDRHRVLSMRADDVAKILGATRVTTLRVHLPALVADRVVRRVGRRWLGRASDIEAWALGDWLSRHPGGKR